MNDEDQDNLNEILSRRYHSSQKGSKERDTEQNVSKQFLSNLQKQGKRSTSNRHKSPDKQKKMIPNYDADIARMLAAEF